MTEHLKDKHVHEWTISIGGVFCVNMDCQEEMSFDEAEARLDATERLSAEDARHIIEFWDNSTSMRTVADKNLRTYADILEGKDG